MNKLAIGVCAGMLLAVMTFGRAASQPRAVNHTVTEAEYERWKKDLSNWGRWGKDDQIGP